MTVQPPAIHPQDRFVLTLAGLIALQLEDAPTTSTNEKDHQP